MLAPRDAIDRGERAIPALLFLALPLRCAAPSNKIAKVAKFLSLAKYRCCPQGLSVGDPSHGTQSPDLEGYRHFIAQARQSPRPAQYSRHRRGGGCGSDGRQHGADTTKTTRSLSRPGSRSQRPGRVWSPDNVIGSTLGVDLSGARARRRLFRRPCVDWTERRPHIGRPALPRPPPRRE
jgi:hypothetical protein